MAEWRRTTLGEIATVVGGGTPSTKTATYWGGDIPWLTPGELTKREGEVVSSTERTISELGLANSSAKLLPVRTVLLTSRATVGVAGISGTPMATNQGFQNLVAGDDVIPEFLMYWIQAHRDDFQSRASGSTFPEISGKKIREVPIAVPSLALQRRIVDVAASVCAVETALADEERQLRVAVARYGEATFGDSAARKVAIGELLQVLIDYRGKTPKKLGYDDFASEGVPVISAIHIKDGEIAWEERARYVPMALFEKWMVERLKAGDVLLTSEAPLGSVAQVESDDPLVLSQRLFALRGKNGILDSGYLRCFLESPIGQSELARRKSGTTVSGIRQAELVKVEVPMRDLSSQVAIANTLASCRSSIARLAAERQRQRSFRLSLLSSLLDTDSPMHDAHARPEAGAT